MPKHERGAARERHAARERPPAHERHGARERGAAHERGAAREGEGEGRAQGATPVPAALTAAGPPSEGAGAAESLPARRHGRPRPPGMVGKRGHRPKEGPAAKEGPAGESSGARPPATTPPPSLLASSTPPVAAPATPIATSVAPAASVPSAAAPPTPVSAPARNARPPRAAVRRSGHGRSAQGASKPRAGVASPSAALAAAGLAFPGAAALGAAGAPPEQAPAPVTGRTAHAGQSTLVKTITRIVGVVPTPLLALVGALAALALALAARSRMGVLRARRLESQRGELLEDVGLLQAALLPVLPARLGSVGTSVAYRPAAGPGAGGDFYDVFPLEDGQLAVIVGDISGHGRAALPHTALVRFTLRAYLEAGLSPRNAMQTAGAVLEHQLGAWFATAVAATYDPRDRVLVYAYAGHPPPVVLGSRPITPTTACSAPPIGVGMRTGTRQTVVSVPGRSQICFYTDGVIEAKRDSELYGVERLTDTLAELGPRATASAVLDRVAAQADRRPDDMAACVLFVDGGPGPGHRVPRAALRHRRPRGVRAA